MNRVIGVIELGRLIRQKWYWILAFLLIGISSAHILTTYVIVPQYSAETKILVSRPVDSAQALELGDIETNIQMINTYRDIIQDPIVLDKVREELGNTLSEEELKGKMEVITQTDSQIFSIQVVDADPERAALIADTIATIFKENVGSVINIDNAAILSPARIPTEPISPHYLFNIVIGALMGSVFGLGLILVQNLADKKVHDENFAAEHLGWLPLGAISTISKKELIQINELIRAHDEIKNPSSTEVKRVAGKEPTHV